MRLLIVEDEPAMAELVCGALQRAGFPFDAAESLASAESFLNTEQYDAVVLDLGLADGDGLTLLRKLRQGGSTLPVLIMTARDTEGDREAGLVTGADDYLVKPFQVDALLNHLRGLLRRYEDDQGAELRLGNLALHTPTRTVTISGTAMTLPPRETFVLEMLLRDRGRVVPREAIEDRLSGFATPASPNTVEVLLNRLRKRLAEASASVVLQTIRGAGYMMTES